MNQDITLAQNTNQTTHPKDNTPQCTLCNLVELQKCICTPLEQNFVPLKSNAVIFKGLVANNPNNPGINLKEGSLSYSQIEGIPLAEVCKVKLCMRNEFMFINTLQVYSSHNESKPVCLGVDAAEASQWLLSLIQAKLILQYQINIGSQQQIPEKVNGVLFKQSMFGKWKRNQASCCTLPPNRCLKLYDEYSGISSTSEVWTRFERVQAKGVDCLVVKLWGTLGKKQLAVPLAHLNLWLRAICTLLS